jgi:hypothetical protein
VLLWFAETYVNASAAATRNRYATGVLLALNVNVARGPATMPPSGLNCPLMVA